MRHIYHRHHIHEQHHPKKRVSRFIEKSMWIVSIVSPLMTIPQIIDVYTTKNVSSLSPTTWFFYTLMPCIWLLYGNLHKDKFIIINSMLWIIVSLVVFVGIMLFR